MSKSVPDVERSRQKCCSSRGPDQGLAKRGLGMFARLSFLGAVLEGKTRCGRLIQRHCLISSVYCASSLLQWQRGRVMIHEGDLGPGSGGFGKLRETLQRILWAENVKSSNSESAHITICLNWRRSVGLGEELYQRAETFSSMTDACRRPR